jgi:UDPglucose 6-dehydrogenase
MREAPSLILIKKFLEAGARVRAYDPVAMHEANRILGDSIEYAADQYDALSEADCLVLVTEWPEFKFPDFNIVGKLLKQKVIFDGRNIYDLAEMKKKGFAYFCIGIDTAR